MYIVKDWYTRTIKVRLPLEGRPSSLALFGSGASTPHERAARGGSSNVARTAPLGNTYRANSLIMPVQYLLR